MPIFEFKCEKCNQEFERVVFAQDKETIVCPKCHATNVKKLISAASFISRTGISGACNTNGPKGFS